jgi:S-adenosylmethionine decarboxylase
MFKGTHLLLDYYYVDFEQIDNIDFVENALSSAISLAGFNLIRIISEKFEPNGLSVLALLKESHISIHTYPENNSMFIDIFTCGEGVPETINQLLCKSFKPQRVKLTKIIRGNE